MYKNKNINSGYIDQINTEEKIYFQNLGFADMKFTNTTMSFSARYFPAFGLNRDQKNSASTFAELVAQDSQKLFKAGTEHDQEFCQTCFSHRAHNTIK